MAKVEMEIESLRRSLKSDQCTVNLKEKGAERYLAIWVYCALVGSKGRLQI